MGSAFHQLAQMGLSTAPTVMGNLYLPFHQRGFAGQVVRDADLYCTNLSEGDRFKPGLDFLTIGKLSTNLAAKGEGCTLSSNCYSQYTVGLLTLHCPCSHSAIGNLKLLQFSLRIGTYMRSYLYHGKCFSVFEDIYSKKKKTSKFLYSDQSYY